HRGGWFYAQVGTPRQAAPLPTGWVTTVARLAWARLEPQSTSLLLAAIGILLIIATLASPLSRRLGVPALVVFLTLGMLAGSDGIVGIPFDDFHLAFRLGSIALVLILFDGGLNTSAAVLRRSALHAGLLATVGVVLTAAIVAGFARLLGVPLATAVLIGAVVSSTDAAAVFSVLRGSGIQLRETIAATLEVEAGLNDPMAVLLTFVATEAVLGPPPIGPGSLWFGGMQPGLRPGRR